MFEVAVRMAFYDHRARLHVSNHDIRKSFKVTREKSIPRKIDLLVADTCREVCPEIMGISIHDGNGLLEYDVGRSHNIKNLLASGKEEEFYDYTNTSDCAILQKWNEHEYHICKRFAPLKYLPKRNCYVGLLEDVMYRISVHFDVIELPAYKD